MDLQQNTAAGTAVPSQNTEDKCGLGKYLTECLSQSLYYNAEGPVLPADVIRKTLINHLFYAVHAAEQGEYVDRAVFVDAVMSKMGSDLRKAQTRVSHQPHLRDMQPDVIAAAIRQAAELYPGHAHHAAYARSCFTEEFAKVVEFGSKPPGDILH